MSDDSYFNLKVKTTAIALLISTTLSDSIQGFSKDLLAPILNYILPGTHDKPVFIGEVPIYLTRFLLRVATLFIALSLVYFLTKNTKIQKSPTKVT